jgi:glycosyltransferase involved in cell wall biosynthesis
MKKVLFLLIGNIRYDGRVQKEINSLREAGYRVILIVSTFDKDDNIQNYDFDIIILNRNNGGNFFIKFIRTFFYFFKIRKRIISINPDLLHCNDLNTLIFSYMIPGHIQIVYDAHELYLENKRGFIKMFWVFVENMLIKKTKAVIVPQIDRLYYMYFRYNLPLGRFYLVENFPLKKENLSTTFFTDKYNISVENKIVITYLGTTMKEREIDLLVQAVEKINDIILFIIGNGPEEYRKEINKLIHNLKLTENVFLMPAIPQYEVLDAINSSDIGVCFYNEKNFNSYFCASNKLYEYLNLGVKVLTNNIAGVIRVVKHEENGYLCDIIDKQNIEKGLTVLLKMNNIKKENYYWDNQKSLFLSIYE